MTVMLIGLAFAGIRSRLLASALTIAIAAAAAGTIVLALEVRSTGIDPWERTFAESNGAHVLAFVPSRGEAVAIGRLSGVTERGAPVALVSATMRRGERGERVLLAGTSRRATVNVPLPTAGSGLRDGGIVLERSFAGALGLRPGETVRLSTSHGAVGVPVLGTAVVPSQARYPRSNPGLAWVTRATLARVEPDRARWRWTEAIRLRDPAAAQAFATRAAAAVPAGPGGSFFQTWQGQRDLALGDAQGTQVIVTMFTVLLLIVAFVVMGILAGARASDQHRQLGLLKAVGLTPRQVGLVFAIEAAALGLAASVLGFALGATLAPELAAPSAETLVGSPSLAANPWHIVVACCVILPVLFAGALTSVRRSTRYSALEAMRAGSVSVPDSLVARAFVRRVAPWTVSLGLRELLVRGRRTVLLAAAVAVTGAVVVTALSLDATLDAKPASEPSDFPDELLLLVYTLDAVLLVITATTLVAIVLLSVRERIRDYGVLKAVGVTPGQIVSAVVGSHTALALFASLLAVPLGIGLYLTLFAIAGDSTEDAVIAPWWSLLSIPIGTVAVVAAATSLPAWLAARIHAADALRYE
jgi:putative ABC transport system permease protein